MFSTLTAHNWQKWKSIFPVCRGHKIYCFYIVEAVSPRNFNNTFKNYNFCEYVKFWAISWKLDILSITSEFKFASENSFAHMLLI